MAMKFARNALSRACWARAVGAAVLATSLVACGGGGGDAPPVTAPPPTELPFSIAVQGPVANNPMGAPITFSTDFAAPAGSSLTYAWDFGDGTTSTSATPSHTYSRAGTYTLRLTLTNEAGASRTSTMEVGVSDLDIVRGRHCTGADLSGWCWQRPLPQGNTIHAYHFVDNLRGWAVGDHGTVMATTDGGATWQPQASNTDMTLRKVRFVDAQVGWVLADHGQVLKTADGGTTWRAVSTGRNDHGFSEIGASDANTAWVGTSYSSLLVTRDGGLTWSSVTAPPYSVQRYVAQGGSDIWATVYVYDASSPLLRTSNGGATWTPIALPAAAPGMSRSVSELQRSSPQHAWLRGWESGYENGLYVSRNVTLYTQDGGQTWQTAAPLPVGMWSASLVESSTAYAWGYSSAHRSTDGGITWQALALPAGLQGSMTFTPISASQLLLRDGSGRVHRSADGGATWSEGSAALSTLPQATSVWFFDGRDGVATAADGSLMTTTNGGQTWASSSPASSLGWRKLQFQGATGWVLSDGGTIYRSVDRGRTWQAPVPQQSVSLSGVSDYHFVDERHGWTVSTWSAGRFHRTTDGGLTWQALDSTTTLSGYQAIRFADTSHGVAVGPTGVALTTSDGGVTWVPRATNITQGLLRVTFIDANTAVAVGTSGAIVRSTDRGHTWTRVPAVTAANLNDVRFVSATVGWAVGDQGVVLHTRDGGLTWQPQASGASGSLAGAFFLDERTGWIAGNNGGILATATGGRR